MFIKITKITVSEITTFNAITIFSVLLLTADLRPCNTIGRLCVHVYVRTINISPKDI